MSELEHCRLAHEGKLDLFREKLESNSFENLATKKDQVIRNWSSDFKLILIKPVYLEW